VVDFEEHPPGPTPAGDESAAPFLVARYDFVLQPRAG
jgi:hydroxyquinol 1,2-dioxygenase